MSAPVGPRFAELYLGPLNAARFDPKDKAQVLAFCAPDSLVQRLFEGMSSAKSAYADTLSPATLSSIDQMFAKARGRLDVMAPLWLALDRHERTGAWDGAGIDSSAVIGSADTGYQLGDAFGHPLIGIALGALASAVKGIVARTNETEQAWALLGQSTQRWYVEVEHDMQQVILPAVDRDVAAKKKGAGSATLGYAILFVAASALIGLGALGHYLLEDRLVDKASGASATSASSSLPATSPLDSLVGTWTNDKRTAFDAVKVGGVVEFRVHDARQLSRQGFHDGDVRFHLSALPSEAATFAVEDHVQPIPPKGMEYDAKATPETCRELWSDVGGAPLRARHNGTRLTVPVVKLDANWNTFDAAGGKVTACRPLQGVHATRVEVLLTRAGPVDANP